MTFKVAHTSAGLPRMSHTYSTCSIAVLCLCERFHPLTGVSVVCGLCHTQAGRLSPDTVGTETPHTPSHTHHTPHTPHTPHSTAFPFNSTF